jgi:hypothetical protein
MATFGKPSAVCETNGASAANVAVARLGPAPHRAAGMRRGVSTGSSRNRAR